MSQGGAYKNQKSIAIAGAGIIGMSIAWRLAQHGFAVTVFDKGSIGGEASWAGAGMLAPGGEFDSLSETGEAGHRIPPAVSGIRSRTGRSGAIGDRLPGMRRSGSGL